MTALPIFSGVRKFCPDTGKESINSYDSFCTCCVVPRTLIVGVNADGLINICTLHVLPLFRINSISDSVCTEHRRSAKVRFFVPDEFALMRKNLDELAAKSANRKADVKE